MVEALIDVDINIAEGEVVGLLGSNGAGKTTLLEILEGLRYSDSGLAEIFGINVKDKAAIKAVRGKIGICLQNSILPQHVTVKELLILQNTLFGKTSSVAELSRLIEFLELGDKQATKVSQLSGGQQQRVAVALSLVSKPALMFLDEPTSQLDPNGRRNVWAALEAGRRDYDVTVLVSTHQMDEAQRLCDKVIIMQAGRVAAMDSPSALIDTYCPDRTIVVLTDKALPSDAVDGQAPHGVVRDNIVETEFRTTNPAKVLSNIIDACNKNAINLVEVKMQTPTLEDVFLRLTGDEGAYH